MTRPAKKEAEERQPPRFPDGAAGYTALDSDDPPDFWVRRPGLPDIALEVTEYHPKAPEGETGRPRVAVEATWWRYLQPAVDRERRVRPALKGVSAHFRLNDRAFPG